MGNLLGAPIVDKETHRGEKADLKFGVSSMQGWRVHMEDAHIMESDLYAYLTKDNTELALPDGHALFAVFDGHGGTFAAEYAGANFCRVFSKQPGVAEYVQQITNTSNTSSDTTDDKQNNKKNAVAKLKAAQNCKAPLEAALQQAFLELDRELALMLQGNPVKDANVPYHKSDSDDPQQSADGDNDNDNDNNNNMLSAASAAAARHAQILSDGGDDSGTTACMVLVTPTWLICANAGDSRAVFSKKSLAVPLSYDHKPDDEEEERRIRTAGGYVAGGRVEGDLAVSRGLGDFRFKQLGTVLEATDTTAGVQKVSPIPDIIVQTRNVEQDDFLIIACDGIWDVMSNQECVNEVASLLLKEGECDMGLLSEELLDVCLEKGSKDNMTAVVVAFPPAMKVATEVAAAAAKKDGGDDAVCGVLARRKKREVERNYSDDGEEVEDEDGDHEGDAAAGEGGEGMDDSSS